MSAAQRVLPLEGGLNFRDLGGYATEDGRKVKWGKVFRSGAMAHLTAGDYAYLARLGLKVICDFRSQGEREAEPTVWPGDTQVTYLSWNYDSGPGALYQMIEGLASADGIKTYMIGLYERIAYDHKEKYRALFDRLADGDVPLVFNCSAGKDRTGTAAALLLSALGVPQTTIVEDYVLTEKVMDRNTILARGRSIVTKSGHSLWSLVEALPAEIRNALGRSDPDYIGSLFTTLTARHGSVLAFIRTELGVDDAKLERLRAQLLE